MNVTDVIDIHVPRTLFGVGALKNIAELVRSLGATKPLIVTDRGLVQAGIVEAVLEALAPCSLPVDVFDGCQAEAPMRIVDEAAQKTRDQAYDLLIGVGAGSVMDLTKAVGLLAAAPDLTAQDLIDGRLPAKSIARILIPTTSGTGSEWSNVAILTSAPPDDRNLSYLTDMNLPEAVVLDPNLTRNLSPRATADAGIDALTHAIEAYTCARANVFTDMCARTAIGLIFASLGPACAAADIPIEDRHRLSMASSLAMLAGSVAGVGLAHFLNHALRAAYQRHEVHILHGAKVGLLMPYVMEYNMVGDRDRFAEIARLMGENTDGLPAPDAAQRSVVAMRRLLSDLRMPQRLSELQISEADIPAAVEEFVTFWAIPTALMNPRPAGRDEATAILRSAL
jgi:alcohol dehydrogenase